MTLVICICTYNRNPSLVKCLKSINNLFVVLNVKIIIIVVDNSINYNSFKLVKKLKKSFKYKIIQLHEKRRGVVYARNKCLHEAKKINPKFICFFDDDCIVDRFWLKNVFKIIKFTNAEIVTGPQIPLKKNSLNNSNLINYSQFFEKRYRGDINRVNWAATNNVFLKYDIIKKHKLVFDKNLNKSIESYNLHFEDDIQKIIRSYFMNYWIASVVYLRSLDYKNISSDIRISIPYFEDNEKFDYKMKFLRREVIKTKIGEINSLLFAPEIPKNKLFKEKDAVKFLLKL